MAGGQLANIVRNIRYLVGRCEKGAPGDRELLHRYAATGDGDAFAALVERHGPLVLGTCRRILGNSHDAEDAFQAVFVVLARKAGAAGWRESVGPWLYEVACRIARKSRARAGLQSEKERRAANMRPIEAPAEPAWGDLRGILDDELSRLPARYRAPLVLCYLEGKSNEAAAEQLGLPAGTVKSRLSRGRDLLRARLTRRGLVLSAEAVGLIIVGNASAAVPGALAENAVQAALHVAAGQAVGGLTGAAAALAEGALRAMWISRLRTIAVGVLVLIAVSGAGWLAFSSMAAVPETGATKPEAKPIALPRNAKAVVLSMGVTGGRIRNASADPYLQIQADGTVTLTDRVTGKKNQSKLSPAELQDLLRFVIRTNDFFAIDMANVKILGPRVTDGTTTTIRVDADGKQHEARFYMASFAARGNPNAKPLVHYASVEWQLNQLAYLTSIGRAPGDKDRDPIALPKDPKAVVLRLSISHKEIPTRKEVRPNGGVSTYLGSPRCDQVLQIQADGTLTVDNRVNGVKCQAKLTAAQVQNVLDYIVQKNEFFKQPALLKAKENPNGWKETIAVRLNDKQHEVIMDGRSLDWFYKDQKRSGDQAPLGNIYFWLDRLARYYVSPDPKCWSN